MKSILSKIISLCMILSVLLSIAMPIAQSVSAVEAPAISSSHRPDGYVPQQCASTFRTKSLARNEDEDDELPRVLLIQDVLPWNSNANETVLSKITEYDRTTTKEFLEVELEKYGVVVFANDQPFSTYDNYAKFKEYLEIFASLGGVIVFGACDSGWADGDLIEMLPGDVSKKTHMVNYNYIEDKTHLIVTGELTEGYVLKDEDMVSSYCSHVSFDEETLPAGSKVIIREKDSNRPTLVEYPLGQGRVIASGLTWEYSFDRNGKYVNGIQVGCFSEMAMEDMFRYAIRVSHIDVDELHLLTEWRWEKNAHSIIVSDATDGMDSMTPIEGADVRVEHPMGELLQQEETDENGCVLTDNFGLNIVCVKADGYRDYEALYQIKKQTSQIFPMEPDKGDGLPYMTMCSGAKNGSEEFVDLRTQSLHFTEDSGDNLLLWMRGNWNGHGDGVFHVYQEAADGKNGVQFDVKEGEYLNISPGKYYRPNIQLKVQLEAKDGTLSEVIEINLEINKKPPEAGDTAGGQLKEGPGTFDWLGSFPIASDDEVFQKLLTTDMSFASELVPMEVAIEHNPDGTTTHKVLIGFASGEYSKGILKDKGNNDGEWNNLKQDIKDFKSNANPKAAWKKMNKKYDKLIKDTKLHTSFDVEGKVIGYAEVTTDSSGKITQSDAGLVINFTGEYVFGKTFLAGPVPLYFEFKPGVKVEVGGGLNFYNDDTGLCFKPVFKGVTLSIPTITLGGGIGVSGVATAGLEGSGELAVSFPNSNDSKTNVDLKLDGSVHIYVMFIADYKWSFASTSIHFYPKEKAGAMRAELSKSITDHVVSLIPRDHVAQWNGSMEPIQGLNNNQFASIVQSSSMPNATPRIHTIDGKQIMLFIQDVSYRGTGNHTQLVYSVLEDGYWSYPQPVMESDSGDFFFSSASDGERLVVAWQKSTVVTDESDPEDLLEDIAEHSEICVAYWDPKSMCFEDQTYLTDNDQLDMMPSVALDGDTIAITWVRNDENNYLGTDGNNEIYSVILNNDGESKPKKLHSTEDYVLELTSCIRKDKVQVLYTAMTEKQVVNLHVITDGKSSVVSKDCGASGLSYGDDQFLWLDGGTLKYYDTGSNKASTMLSGGNAISSSYHYVSQGDSRAVLWSEAGSGGYLLKACVKNGSSWSTPVVLMQGQNDTVSHMDAQVLKDGSFGVILNTVDYNEDGDVENCSIQYVNITPQGDISVDLAEPQYPDWKKDTQDIDIVVTNNGSLPVTSFDLLVSTENGSLLKETVSMELNPGASALLTKTMDISSVDGPVDATVSVSLDNDANPEDNQKIIPMGYVDATLDLDVYERGDEFLFALSVSNASPISANAALSIVEDSADGVVLNMKNIGTVSNEETVQYLYSVDRSKIDFKGETSKTYFFLLDTREKDWMTTDNVLHYTIYAPGNIETDPDGKLDTYKSIPAESVKIDHDSLLFIGDNMEPVQLKAQILPKDSTMAGVTWSVENGDVVHITSDGLVTPLGDGTTTITARVNDEILDTITVSVLKDGHATVTFDPQGGKVDPETATTNEKGTLDSLPEAKRFGYKFKGWFTAAEGGEEVTENTLFHGDTTIYAQWKLDIVAVFLYAGFGLIALIIIVIIIIVLCLAKKKKK